MPTAARRIGRCHPGLDRLEDRALLSRMPGPMLPDWGGPDVQGGPVADQAWSSPGPMAMHGRGGPAGGAAWLDPEGFAFGGPHGEGPHGQPGGAPGGSPVAASLVIAPPARLDLVVVMLSTLRVEVSGGTTAAPQQAAAPIVRAADPAATIAAVPSATSAASTLLGSPTTAVVGHGVASASTSGASVAAPVATRSLAMPVLAVTLPVVPAGPPAAVRPEGNAGASAARSEPIVPAVGPAEGQGSEPSVRQSLAGSTAAPVAAAEHPEAPVVAYGPTRSWVRNSAAPAGWLPGADVPDALAADVMASQPVAADLLTEPSRDELAAGPTDDLLGSLLSRLDRLDAAVPEPASTVPLVVPLLAGAVAVEAARRWRKRRLVPVPVRGWIPGSCSAYPFS